MSEPFTVKGLTPRQMAIIVELERNYPNGRLETRDGKPFFLGESNSKLYEVDLVTLKAHWTFKQLSRAS